MKLKDITINNFRGIRSLHLPLDDLTVLIGENNAGKSTVLEALKLVLTRGFGSRKDSRFAEYDFHLKDAAATPLTADPIEIILHYAEENYGEWPDAISQQLNEVVQLDVTNGTNHIWLQATGAYQPVTTSFKTSWAFLNAHKAGLPLKNNNAHNLLATFLPLFFLSAIRDASQEFGQRGQFWNSFLKTIDLPIEQIQEIEEKLQEVNASVIDANEDLGKVISKIGETRKFVPLAAEDPVVLEAIPTRLFDLTGKVQVHLKSLHGAKLPLHRHGEGTQNLAVLMLFQAFTVLNLAEAYAPESTPLLALEEPEAHLHPSAIRSLGTLLKDITGQRVVTSHSGDLVSRVPITSLRRLYKQNDETKVGKIDFAALTPEEMRHFEYHVRITKGAHLFARCWLLVEGQSEFWLFPKIADILNYAFDEKNIAVIEFSQGGGPPPFIKAAQNLGIEWFVVADGDNAGDKYSRAAENCLGPEELKEDHVFQFFHDNLELELWNSDLDNVFINAVPSDKLEGIKRISHVSSPNFPKRVIEEAIKIRTKPRLACDIAAAIEQRGADAIPESIKDVITRVVQLAGG